MNIDVAREIDGWMSENELRFLAHNASKYNLILEAGCYKGRSTRAMADNTNGVIFAIDPWNGDYRGYNNPNDIALRQYNAGQGPEIWGDFKKNLKPYIDNGHVIPIHSFFTDFKP